MCTAFTPQGVGAFVGLGDPNSEVPTYPHNGVVGLYIDSCITLILSAIDDAIFLTSSVATASVVLGVSLSVDASLLARALRCYKNKQTLWLIKNKQV